MKDEYLIRRYTKSREYRDLTLHRRTNLDEIRALVCEGENVKVVCKDKDITAETLYKCLARNLSPSMVEELKELIKSHQNKHVHAMKHYVLCGMK